MEWVKPSRWRAALALTAVATVAGGAMAALPPLLAFGPASFVELGGLSAGAAPARITAGPDGNLWFTEPGVSKIGQMTTGGAIKEFATASAGAGPSGITSGPDGNLWFTEPTLNRLGTMTTAGAASEVGLGSGTRPARIVPGPGGLWVTEPAAHAVVQVSTGGGVLSTVTLNDVAATPTDLTVGPDGNIWFSQASVNGTPTSEIGRLNLAQSPDETTTTLRTSAATAVFGQTVTLTATVTALGGAW